MIYLIAAVIFLVVCLVFAFLGALLYLIYKPFKKWLLDNGKLSPKNSQIINKSFIALLLSLSIYFTWTAFFPSDDFYEEEFEQNTGMDFPKSGVIIATDSGYPDLHGDYSASAMVDMDKNEFEKLKLQLSSQVEFQIDTTKQNIGITMGYRKMVKNINEEDIDVVYYHNGKEWFKIAFLKNGKTIIFERSS
ncbi:hypothetical protein FEE95_19320 [Maribacter algarum]|uniref:Uncharacterized protein n=1 Tax=Maribacter algarum (ex Zhang et al. 2020) TaxID=2578118 RepID=A0A5S3PGF7_9FLAO|nr:hypothetical protein [Maribacter algarum]TMM53220.1 hypothetical protein FEE95_19320 [Maribacter algarum]